MMRRASVILFCFTLVFGVLVPTGILIWQSFAPTVAISSSDIGEFVSANSTPGGLFSQNFSSVQSTSGTVTIEGAISVAKGQKLVLRTINKQGVQLCVGDDLGSCVQLASPWFGPMKPAPQSGDAYDFQRYGLTTPNVQSWLKTGFLVLFALSLLLVESIVFPASKLSKKKRSKRRRY
ncbi:hypothetical protein [Rhodanobacter aciditrophus]|uniref:hypothetical protein n=1 Tax=Rhodanobacter aciditrophus TaxID=1623218 RepID=UPI003CE91B1C